MENDFLIFLSFKGPESIFILLRGKKFQVRTREMLKEIFLYISKIINFSVSV